LVEQPFMNSFSSCQPSWLKRRVVPPPWRGLRAKVMRVSSQSLGSSTQRQTI
jgi:hypothetical protein